MVEHIRRLENRVRHSYGLGLVLITAATLAWSVAGLFTRWISVDTGTMLVWRGVFGAVGIFVVICALQGRNGIAAFARLGRVGWAYAVVSGLGMICFITALRLTTVAHVSIIYATVPLVAAGLGWVILRERPARSAVVASLFALLGVTIMVGLGTDGALSGDLLAFGMTMALAVMMVISRRFPDLLTLQAACLSALLSGIIALPVADGLIVEPDQLGLLALFGLVNSALGLALFALGSRLLPPVETALITALDAPLAPVWVWLVFGEVIRRDTLLGGAIVFAAVLVHLVRHTRRGAAR